VREAEEIAALDHHQLAVGDPDRVSTAWLAVQQRDLAKNLACMERELIRARTRTAGFEREPAAFTWDGHRS